MKQRLAFDITVGSQLAVGDLRLADLEAMRLVLRGGSVINWYRQSFRTREAVHDFLRVNGFDPEDDVSRRRLVELLEQAAGYIQRNFHYQFPPELIGVGSPEDVFLLASSNDEHQKLACMLLKVAHVINHLEGYELRHWLPVRDQALFELAERQIDDGIARVRASGVVIDEYQASRKARDSLITKLLSKRRTIAAQIFDKLRFRLIAPRREDLVPLLCGLTRQVLPFNYVIPGESRNDILDLDEVAAALRDPLARATLAGLDPTAARTGLGANAPPPPGAAAPPPPINPFTSNAYQVINFVVDLPVRVDSVLDDLGPRAPRHLGQVVFVLVEFQLLDRETYERNERGPANHTLYKRRQRQTVLRRLVWGQRVPRPGGAGGGGAGTGGGGG